MIDHYEPDIVTAQDYYPFGMMSRVALPNNDRPYRFGFNGQEMNNDVKGLGNSYTAQFWEYDSRIGRRWNLDPKPITGISQYSAFNNSPAWFSDKLGDSSVIDNRGYILHYDRADKDLRVFMLQKGKLTQVGTLGDKIDASVWFANLLKDNSQEINGIFNPLRFYNRVRHDKQWDYKYRSSSNQDEDNEVQKMPFHILGVAFQRKDKSSKGIGDLGETTFTWGGFSGRAEDLNNFHFGVVGKAYGLFTEELMERRAGIAEMDKRRKDFIDGKEPSPEVPAPWRPIIYPHRPPAESQPELGRPYGDNPIDNKYLRAGFKYFDENKVFLLKR